MQLEQLREEIAATIGISAAEITEDANLVDLGLDSLGAMRLATAWNRRGIPLKFGDLIAAPTLSGWKAVLDAAAPAPEAAS
ncbi:phosphopantetheine-binding protein [Amycolatopsis jejuensis]|uniref:phosphopantetheine-binding protein n=1 Tax=Amycolatopsis jejuensis TaxID=330084 RepID=UPI00068B0A28|nr:phosphopantetheine-binding protein [Amycolatopsis jejuensis]